MAFVAADYHAEAHYLCLQVYSRKLTSCTLSKQTHLYQTHTGLQEVSLDQIQALCQRGHVQKALHLVFTAAIPPTDRVYLALLKACKAEKALAHSQHIYTHLITHSSKKISSMLGNYLVLTLVTCGGIDTAYQAFQKLTHVTASSWLVMISGYAELGQASSAFEMYKSMLEAGVEPNSYILVVLLKLCGSIQDREGGKKLHADAVERGYSMDVFVGSTLVSMYGKCESLLEAEYVFGSLVQRNVVSWNALLATYVDANIEEKAFGLYRQMQGEGVSPNNLTFVAAFQACGILGTKALSDPSYEGSQRQYAALGLGRALHADARKKGLALNLYVQSTIMTMYRKCDSLTELEAVFVGLSEPNAVSWNVILSAYVEYGQEKKALQLYRKMQEEGVGLDRQTHMAALVACCNIAEKEEVICLEGPANKVVAYELCQALHFDIRREGLASDAILGSLLISIYGKCGTLPEAEDAFNCLVRPDVVAWNAMLSVYVERAQEEKAFRLYRQMQEDGLCQDDLTLLSVFQTCGSLAGREETGFEGRCTKTIALEIGMAEHAITRKQGFEPITCVANNLISMYGKCGCIRLAELIFSKLLIRDIASWNAMLSVYVEKNQYDLALQLYLQLRRESYAPDIVTFIATLRACGIAADEEAMAVGRQAGKEMVSKLVSALHSEASMMGFDLDRRMRSRLISVYGKCRMIVEAENIFVGASQADTLCWNSLLIAYIDSNQGERALQLYKLMQSRNSVDEHIMVAALKSCVSILKKEEATINGFIISDICLEIGLCLHVYAHKNGFDSNVFVGSILISIYGKCRCISRAEHVFDKMSQKNKVLWNAMLSAYVEYGDGARALQLFGLMQGGCTNFDGHTLTIVLQACCVLAEKEEPFLSEGRPLKACTLRIGHTLHVEMAQNQAFLSDVFIVNALINMYGKCGAIREAELSFLCICEQTSLPWNGILSAYVEYEHWEKVLELYGHMEKTLMALDDVTLGYALQASSQTGSMDVCKRVHFIIFSSKTFVGSRLATILIHAYSDFGCMLDAEAVFHDLSQPDVVTWSTCISGFAKQGNSNSSFHFLNGMYIEEIMADKVTSSSMLSACSHAGLVDEGVYYFDCMRREFGLIPDVKLYANLLDLLARAGNLAKVEYILKKMSVEADLAIWVCVLNACCLHGNLELAKLAFSSAVQLQPPKSVGYSAMLNMYWQLDPINSR